MLVANITFALVKRISSVCCMIESSQSLSFTMKIRTSILKKIKLKFKSLLSINSVCLSPIQVGRLQIYTIHIITFNQ